MTCRGCGNKNAYHLTSWVDGEAIVEVCDQCRPNDVGLDVGVPDVYWPGHAHYNPNICDKMGRPILLQSRQHKAQVMKKLGIREAGDPIRGARTLL